ncbi:hypothetical protein [Streptomyces sp. M92]|uniref:hypothetical protein n=1 Tax=Streptomyces sp. M92 TaxID=2944250 RepID=UPI00234AEB94|nr:hypothetical protein [Streptomyces sp. M92]WCN04290.1 hypothetical protein M6G08_20470 [Streptomyces sp. M92]
MTDPLRGIRLRVSGVSNVRVLWGDCFLFISAALRPALRAVTVVCLAVATVLIPVVPASAHRHPCHARHSCESDTGSYVCGDKGDASMCASGRLGRGFDEGAVDLVAPSEPEVKNPVPRPGGKASVTVSAERGATIVVSEEYGDEVARATATGAEQTLTFQAGDGERTYTVTVTDAADNVSVPSDTFTIKSDAEAPDLESFEVKAADPTNAAVEVTFLSGEYGHYELAVAGRKDKITGEAVGGTTVTESLWLPNGDHKITVAVMDAVGNVTRRTEPATVELSSLKPKLGHEDVSRESRVLLPVDGPPEAVGEVRVGGMTRKVTLDKGGSAVLAFDLPDGTYHPEADLVDRFGRHGTVSGEPILVDTRAPALTAVYDEEAARHGTAAITVTSEPGTDISLSERGVPMAAGRLSSARESVRLTADLRPGRHRLTVSAVDRAGNKRTHDLLITVRDDMTTAEIVRTVLWVLAIAVVAGVTALLLWRGRRTISAWWERRREAARAAVALRAQAARERQLRREQEQYERDMTDWRAEHRVLSELHDLARNPKSEAYEADRFRWGRRKKDERVLLVLTARLVEVRNRQGVISLEETERGEVAVTDRRVLFAGPAKRREWDYARWLDHEHLPQGATVIMVSNRQKASGIAYPVLEARRVRLVIALALADHRGTREQIVRRTRRELEAHAATRPEPPRTPETELSGQSTA